LKKYFTLYGVGIFDADNSAVACGYSGQHLVRDPVNHIWRDRSSFTNDPVHATNAVTLPLFGAEANQGNGSTGTAYITGMGGYVRRSTNGGQSWTTEQLGEPWRVRDTWFFDQNTGWMVGQFFRLARSTDGGRTWTPAAPEPQLGTGFLNSIAFSNPAIGVAVGDIDLRPGPNQNKPKILITSDGGASAWLEPTIYPLRPVVQSTHLNEVASSGALEFWAVGDGGLMLHTPTVATAGTSSCLPTRPIRSCATSSSRASPSATRRTGSSSARGPNLNGGERGVAYLYRNSNSQVTWSEISPADPGLTILADVDVSGDVAYAVGVRGTGASRLGVAFSSTATGGAFGAFTELVHPTFPACDVDEDLDKIPVLNEVEIAPDGDVWIGGEMRPAVAVRPAGQWIEQKSSTDAHVLGLSVPPNDTGFPRRPSREPHRLVDRSLQAVTTRRSCVERARAYSTPRRVARLESATILHRPSRVWHSRRVLRVASNLAYPCPRVEARGERVPSCASAQRSAECSPRRSASNRRSVVLAIRNPGLDLESRARVERFMVRRAAGERAIELRIALGRTRARHDQRRRTRELDGRGRRAHPPSLDQRHVGLPERAERSEGHAAARLLPARSPARLGGRTSGLGAAHDRRRSALERRLSHAFDRAR
jgi:hypothetical protein